MSRAGFVFCLTHSYPLFLAINLFFGSKTRLWCVTYNVVPLIIFGGLISVWVSTSHIKLSKREQICLNYFLWNLVFITVYYLLCIYSLPAWAYEKNYQVGSFVAITLIFYTLNRNECKRYPLFYNSD